MVVYEELKFLRKFTQKIGGGGGGSGVFGLWECSGWGGQGGCERKIEVFVKIQKGIFFFWGGGGGRGVGSGGGASGWGGQGEVNEELKFFFEFFFLRGGVGREVGLGGQVGCVRRIEVFEKVHTK